MGYRSDVVLAMKDEKFAELVKSMDDRIAANFFEMTDEPKKKKDWTLVFISCVKWYEEYPEVKAVDNFVDTLDEDDYAYHILGEENDDYTHKGTWETPFDIRMTRSLDFDW
jgi:hypothetical protein